MLRWIGIFLVFFIPSCESCNSCARFHDNGFFAEMRYYIDFGRYNYGAVMSNEFVAPSNDIFCFGFRIDENIDRVRAGRAFISLDGAGVRVFYIGENMLSWVESRNAYGVSFFYYRDSISSCVRLFKGARYRISSSLSAEGEGQFKMVGWGGGWKS